MRILPPLSLAALAVVLASAAGRAGAGPDAPPPLPERLSATGLFAPGQPERIGAGIRPFSPQYPLWSDGAGKRRWFALPAGTAIDATNADAWVFPPGARFWKEFTHGRKVETRFIERLADGTWRYATYVWDGDGADATLAPERGLAALAVADAPGGRYTIPSRGDCRACHDGATVPILGFGALQLSPDRDPLAPHAEPARTGDADLRALVAAGLLVNLPPALLATPPRIAAATPRERAALGYLHGNCGNCHHRSETRDTGVPVDLVLLQTVAADAGAAHVLHTLLSDAPRYRPAGQPADARLVAPGASAASVLPARMRSRDPLAQMPPLGSRMPDAEALALIDAWIDHDLTPREDRSP